jgi:hypothetical protein
LGRIFHTIHRGVRPASFLYAVYTVKASDSDCLGQTTDLIPSYFD